uniref:Uncharacterized protein n=1 Tax=Seriola lalandi dorsalis TaxID=1841481 RepID=A0A3B4XQG9_SERLL
MNCIGHSFPISCPLIFFYHISITVRIFCLFSVSLLFLCIVKAAHLGFSRAISG